MTSELIVTYTQTWRLSRIETQSCGEGHGAPPYEFAIFIDEIGQEHKIPFHVNNNHQIIYGKKKKIEEIIRSGL